MQGTQSHMIAFLSGVPIRRLFFGVHDGGMQGTQCHVIAFPCGVPIRRLFFGVHDGGCRVHSVT